MNEDPARRRFMAIQATRWVGVALVLFGLLVINGRVNLPRDAGYILFLAGILGALFMPTVLARRWKSPPP
jgi:drug/metabolite transporter (DMT)-like permease